MTTERKVTVITVGTADWEPTCEDMERLVQQFQECAKKPAGLQALVIRNGVTVRNIEPSVDVRCYSAWMTDRDVELACEAYMDAYCKDMVEREATRKQRGVDAFRAALDKRLNQD